MNQNSVAMARWGYNDSTYLEMNVDARRPFTPPPAYSILSVPNPTEALYDDVCQTAPPIRQYAKDSNFPRLSPHRDFKPPPPIPSQVTGHAEDDPYILPDAHGGAVDRPEDTYIIPDKQVQPPPRPPKNEIPTRQPPQPPSGPPSRPPSGPPSRQPSDKNNVHDFSNGSRNSSSSGRSSTGSESQGSTKHEYPRKPLSKQLPKQHSKIAPIKPTGIIMPRIPPIEPDQQPNNVFQSTFMKEFNEKFKSRKPSAPQIHNRPEPGMNHPSIPMVDEQPIPSDTIEDQPWFSDVNRQDALQHLRSYRNRDGQFILRPRRESNAPYALTLIAENKNEFNLLIRKRSDNRYAVGSEKANEESFSTIQEMIQYYMNNDLKLAKGGKIRLVLPH